MVDPAAPPRLVDAGALVQPVEHRVRPDLAGEVTEVAVAGADVQPRPRRGERLEHVDPPAIGVPRRVEYLLRQLLAEAVVAVTVVKVQSGGGEAGILEDVPAGAALFQGEPTRLSLNEIGCPQPDRNLSGAAPGTSIPTGFEESLDAGGQLRLVIRPGVLVRIGHVSFSRWSAAVGAPPAAAKDVCTRRAAVR
jgi:hypothetical protein